MGILSYQEASDAHKILASHIKRKYEVNLHGERWRNLPELPSADEIMHKPELQHLPEESAICGATDNRDDYQRDPLYDPNLPLNRIDGPWESKLTYVGAHYQLLRENAVAALRRSVGEIHANPSMDDDDDTCIYTHVSWFQDDVVMLLI